MLGSVYLAGALVLGGAFVALAVALGASEMAKCSLGEQPIASTQMGFTIWVIANRPLARPPEPKRSAGAVDPG